MKVKLHFLPKANVPAVALLQNTSIELAESAIPQQGDILRIEGIAPVRGRFVVHSRQVYINTRDCVAMYELLIELDESAD